ncbi:HpcH/HpaI aldolase/citrate lyase family protein [Leptospira selangorensis]|uniref:HpcH/HpaI aldolase/citrate lyase family protein n=1 Tax=Leptospira selangorensis TaxID=2484982 RepID=UPI001ABF804C|nr:aldolase/citrate lyase family protein [Leptospira selangorensis]
MNPKLKNEPNSTISHFENPEPGPFHKKILNMRWPGIQLYYPPVKFIPKESKYEDLETAADRLNRIALHTRAHTLLFDLEDGCARKALSRELLRKEIHIFSERKFQTAIRINPFLTEEYEEDLLLLKDIGEFVDVVVLAKAGEQYGTAEIRDLSSYLVEINPSATVQPIIEHPRSLKLAAEMMQFSTVQHLIFGIHDFSKAMAIHISPENWLEELKPYLYDLLIEARQAGRGIIGGVDPMINGEGLPDNAQEASDVRRWLDLRGDKASRIVFEHATKEMSLGLTGKQVIHPNHINLCRAAFVPSPGEVKRNIRILEAATDAGALLGGAIRFEGEMLDPPMFGKALQVLLRAKSLGELPEGGERFVLSVLKNLPNRVVLENWPYAGFN